MVSVKISDEFGVGAVAIYFIVCLLAGQGPGRSGGNYGKSEDIQSL
jgi:hypothetical protein